MQDSPIQIGPISLHGFEIPTSVRFGGRHRLAVHTLTGGRRLVERLGPDDGEIEFRGIFSGPNAETRVRALNELRLSGETIWLTWETFRHLIVLKSFVAEYHSPWWIPYKVSCVVVHQAGTLGLQTSTLLSLVSSDLGSALSAAAGTPLSLAPLQAALASPNALTTGTTNQTQSVSAVNTTLENVNSQITMQSALLTSQNGNDTDPGNTSQALTAAVASAGLLAASINVGSYVGRIGSNLNGSGT